MANIEPNEQYKKYLYRWNKVLHVLDGEDKLKEIDLSILGVGGFQYNPISTGVSGYLRLLNYPADSSDYNVSRNAGYIRGAKLYNASKRTLNGFLGMVYSEESVLPDLPNDMQYLIENVNGAGTSLIQQSKSVVDDVVSIGRDGLLVDMPRNSEGKALTRQDVADGFRPVILEYKAKSIIDWNESTISNVKQLDLLVLTEQVTEFVGGDDLGISREIKTRYRVYRLVDGRVTVRVFNEGEENASEVNDVINANGQPATKIPFCFIGSENNEPSVDSLPLEALVNINLGHYQESANLSLSSFQFGAAQPYVADDGYQKAVRNENENGGDDMLMGDGVAMILGTGGSMMFAAPPANTMGADIRDAYEKQMVALGAQIITDGGQAETAEAARINHASDTSILSTVVKNVSDAYNRALSFAADFMGVKIPEDQKLILNTDFFDTSITAEELSSLVASWQGAAISKSVLDSKLVKGKVIDSSVDLDAMNGEIEAANPTRLSLDD